MSLPSSWTALTTAANLPKALFDHLAPVLGTTSDNRTILEKITARATSASLNTRHPEEEYHSLVIDLGTDKLDLSLPWSPEVRTMRLEEEGCMPPPPSYERIIELHGSIKLVDAQVDMFFESSVEEEGWFEGTDLEGKGVFAPLRVYADMYIYHPDEKNADGEPTLYFLDHESMGDDGPQRADGDIATVFLKHVAKSLKL